MHEATATTEIYTLSLHDALPDQAEKYYLEALAIKEKVLGREHPDVANELGNLGILYKD